MKHDPGVLRKTSPDHRLGWGRPQLPPGLPCKPSAIEAARQRYVVQASEVPCTEHTTFQHEQLTSNARIVKSTSQFTCNVRVMFCLAVVPV
jgi:hypothetical protein